MALFHHRKPEQGVELVEPVERPTLPPGPGGEDGHRSLDEERDYLLSLVNPLAPFGMGLVDASGLAICEDILAEADVPSGARAQVDGYALRAGDISNLDESTQVTLRVREDVDKVGSAVRVRAGDALPAGADAVVPVERTDLDDDVVTIHGAVRSGDEVLQTGAIASRGKRLVHSGQLLDARLVGLLGVVGIDKVLARPRPRVVVLSVGEDLVEVGHPVGPGQRRDLDSRLLAAAAQGDGAQVWRVACVTSVEDARTALSDQVIRADLLISCGGLAGGRHSMVGHAVADLGLSDFADVAMTPGGTIGFGLVSEEEVPLLMLPGESVAAYIGYLAFGEPLVRKLMGVDPRPRISRALTQASVPASPDLTRLQPVRLRLAEEHPVARPIAERRRATLADLVDADALAVLPPQEHAVAAGEWVDLWALGNP